VIIIADKQGQLANRLFVFASFLAFGSEYNIQVINPAFEEYASYFEHFQKELLCSYPSVQTDFIKPTIRSRKIYYKISHYVVRLLEKLKFTNSYWHHIISINLNQSVNLQSPAFLSLAKSKNLLFCKGWRFQNNGLEKQQSLIRKLFRPLSHHQRNITDLMDKARKKAEIIIGVHIRWGDYKTFLNGKYYYEMNDYLMLMKKVKLLFEDKKVIFIVCSNEKQNIENFYEIETMFGNNHIIEDLYTFSVCDFLLGPPSTYTMWASFYGNVPLYQIADPDKEFTVEDFKVYTGSIQ
jgi:hypothetical protein